MKKRLKLILLAVLMIILVVIISIKVFIGINSNEKLEKSTGIKMLALAILGVDRCEETEPLKYFSEEMWYSEYASALYDAGYINTDDIKPTEKEYAKNMTYGELYDILDRASIEYKSLADKDDYIEVDDFFDFYGETFADTNISTENIPVAAVTEELLITPDTFYKIEGDDYSKYVDKTIEAYVIDNIIIAVKSMDNQVKYDNIIIREYENGEINCVINNTEVSYEVGEDMKIDMSEGYTICDVTMKKGKVTSIDVKSDKIMGEVIAYTDEYVEIANYGPVYLSDNYKVYKSYSNYEKCNLNEIAIGYKNIDFIVADGEICGVMLREDMMVDNIRVIICNNNYESIYHNTVEITQSSDYEIVYADGTAESHLASDTLLLDLESELLSDGRITLKSSDDNRFTISSITRSNGVPSYSGNIEILKTDKGLVVINDVSLEEYLRYVVPSEMPANSSEESLKAQAVCARSYAYGNIVDGAYKEYGAHVDDSQNYQVYNNLNTSENVINAVNDTSGIVMFYNENPVKAYYYSTSCGHTSTTEVWGDDSEEVYGYVSSVFVNDNNNTLDLSKEEDFTNFIKDINYESYDSDYPFYRWNATLSSEEICSYINQKLGNRSSVSTDITHLEGDEYISGKIDSIGTLTNIEITKRAASGSVLELIITGSEATIRVTGEYNIRALLSGSLTTINLKNGTKRDGLSVLPSSYFTIETEDNLEYHIYGGGFGHGVGMSQNAAINMGSQGMEYEDILDFFYDDIEYRYVYDK